MKLNKTLSRSKYIKIAAVCTTAVLIAAVFSYRYYNESAIEKKADNYFHNSDYENALQYYNQLSEKTLFSSDAIINKAVCENKLGQYNNSLNDLSDCEEKCSYINKNPDFMFRINMCRSSDYHYTEQYEKSNYYLDLIQKNMSENSPFNLPVQVQLVNNYFMLNDGDHCVSILNSIKSNYGNNNDNMYYYYFTIGQVYDYIKKDYNSAIINYNNAVKLKPSEIDIYNKISWVYFKQGNNDFEKQLLYLKSVQKNIKDNEALNEYISDVEKSFNNYNKYIKNDHSPVK